MQKHMFSIEFLHLWLQPLKCVMRNPSDNLRGGVYDRLLAADLVTAD